MGEIAADLALPPVRGAWSDRPDRTGRRARDWHSNSSGFGRESGEQFVTLGQDSRSRAAATLAAFSANGLFAGLSGLFLATTLHHHSHALSGATLFLVFSSGVAAQLATTRLPASRVLALGTISMLIGLALLVTAVRLSTPSLALFLLSGALIGAGAGAVFKGTTGVVLRATAPENRLAMTSDLLIALYVGLSIPVIGAGVALDRGASGPDTVLGFAILVGVGVVGAGALLGAALRNDFEKGT
ncbi:MAG: hypothetical protein ACYDHH_19820 [Solirubrobacteraceae bacterium]